MLSPEYIMIRSIAICDLAKSEHLHLVKMFAGEAAPPCIAEALMNWFTKYSY